MNSSNNDFDDKVTNLDIRLRNINPDRIDITDTLEYKSKLPVQGKDESNLEYLKRVKDITSVMDVLKDLCNVSFKGLMVTDDSQIDSEQDQTYKILYEIYTRLLKDQERLLKKAGEWNV